ncbi:LPXTG-motif cell wall anchor domain-containing protein [Bifidobacterium pseudolongum subsp. pseudolongum]|uniref:LPXTG-motif cell wall anchor domain-containing protein n=1 Tax=Bifidobacterium pseudolongum subsp. pseudolongum TaxID=31954 RepID=A0A4Q5A6D6_9BIFI|nr:hypothetical protein [Bifidobacterium pseudolongum]MDY3689300.1 hypothetical protein [Bifidobacterium pseudolongum]RYQ19684.1 LPXTG-motif cell wall anchor domain-containing protein [Bifidobacterium pseudolongum subsp. pseudolongum]RYQ47820.1 LPXTG-motif cell wall anchor domain-containing protein [Bifidobacterium pseudolongum subsp. pseudolongum]RYQ51684.1 LPXTG-motif cell wall anchor domain-containing protein [Bifidobacterium pseudolongum subsp. pseudolongum]
MTAYGTQQPRPAEPLHRRFLAALAACVAVALALAAPWSAAVAAPGETLATAKSEDYFLYTHNGSTYWIGPIGYDSAGGRYYCIEQTRPTSLRVNAVSPLPDSPQNRRIAALLRKYQHVHNSDYTQTALAIIVHDAFDDTTGSAGWGANRETLRQYPRLFERVDELLAEAPQLVPETMTAELEYDPVTRTGNVRLHIRNGNGGTVAGVPFTLTIDGPARFGNGSTTVTGTSGDYTTVITWHATGDGPVTVTGSATVPSIDRIISTQDMVTLGGGHMQAIDEVTIPVRYSFNPTITTRTSPKSIDTGAPVTDDVQVSALSGSGAWPRGAQIHARGWYFGGLPIHALGERYVPNAHAAAPEFLEQLARAGYEPCAFAEATFDSSGQTVHVQGMREPGSDEPYLAEHGGFGTWVWAIERERQSSDVRALLTGDVITPFMEPNETHAVRAPLTVASRVVESTVQPGAQIADVIHVSGFPDEHGDWAGSDEHGIDTDAPFAQVRVWWADSAYEPADAQEPEEDDHHTLIGTWEYEAVNGEIHVGAGAPDAYGEPVEILAERPGWYVFVWEFAGDGRVQAATSSYADPQERVRVQMEPVPQSVPEATPEPERKPEAEAPRSQAPALAATGVSNAWPITLGLLTLLAAVILVIRHKRELEDGD